MPSCTMQCDNLCQMGKTTWNLTCGVEYPAILCSGMIIFVCSDGTPGTEATMQFREEKQFWERKLSPQFLRWRSYIVIINALYFA